jgi:hypothetical protein
MNLSLPNVTLIAVASLDIDQTNAALLHSAKHIEFGAIKLLCSTLPTTTDNRVTYVPIPQIDYLGYQRFMIESLNAYVQTDHCLVIQADGFVLDPTRWHQGFLKYDYIGAPWPETVAVAIKGASEIVSLRLHKNCVGNGGFSLRSKRLLEATSALQFDNLNFPEIEDLLICHFLYENMRDAGIQFAPPDLAATFSIEAWTGRPGHSFNSVFGFHGKRWLPDAFRRIGGKNIGIASRLNQFCPCGSGRKYKHCCGAYG